MAIEVAGDSAMAAEAVVEVAEEPVVRQAGQLLREAREARGLSVFEVAQSLKFGVRQIEALEADNYGALPPGATFLRGFVRGYAKLLKLDPVPLLELLDGRAPSVMPEVRAPQNMGVAATPVVAGRRSSSPLLIGAAVIAIVAAGLAAWHFTSSPPPTGPAKSADQPVVAAAPNGDTETVRPPDIRVEQTPVAGGVAQPANMPLPPDQKQLVFAFQDKSWVEVRDASQRIIFSGESQPGTRQAVAGKPPFQLVVGNAAKVELQYEDRLIDLKPHIRAEVARLTVE
ncbi:MAG: DUF4115 domain-containing protein [Sterolibacteriaceae bacterium MAG5]|nr:DUF4115 domain-containing protein [Candidatus Nitricoxidireducens bremensis]